MHCGLLAGRLWATPCLQHTRLFPCGHRPFHFINRCLASTVPDRGLHVAQTAAGLPSVEDVLQQLQAAVGLKYPRGSEVCFSGHGTHLGLSVSWQLRCRADGAFVEEIRGQHLSFIYGHPGISSGGALRQGWGIEWDGLPKELQLDDHEAMLMQSWVRTGFFASELAREHLSINVLPSSQAETAGATGGELTLASPMAVADAREGEDGAGRLAATLHLPREGASSSGDAGAAEDILLSLQLKHGKVRALLWVCPETWRPQRLSCPLCGQLEVSQYHSWRHWQGKPRVWHPQAVLQQGGTGGNNKFATESVRWQPDGGGATYEMPPCPVRPADARFDPTAPQFAQAWWTAGGHVLVQPRINGHDELGFFILDTGASGCVIERAAADRHGLSAFGELYVAGMAGRIRSRFRRARTLQLGPLTLSNPLFMEMPIGGLIKGAPGPCIGIVGYDVFRSAVLRLPPPPRDGAGRGSVRLELSDPVGYTEDAATAAHWQELHMLANLPHVLAQFGCKGPADAAQDDNAAPPAPATAMFLLDSGAGGVEVMFHSRAVDELRLSSLPQVRTHSLKGVGGAHLSPVRMQSGRLPWLRLGRTQFDGVMCLLAGSAGGPDFSFYTHGALCAGLLARCTTVLDYARARIAFLPTRAHLPR